MHASSVGKELWAEAVNCATYVLNRIAGSTVTTTPYETWYGKKPNIEHLRVFGSSAFVHIPKEDRQKLDAKSERCLFVGYSEGQKAWRFWNPVTRKIKVSRDATIYEEEAFGDTSPDPQMVPLAQSVVDGDNIEQRRDAATNEHFNQQPTDSTLGRCTSSKENHTIPERTVDTSEIREKRERRAPAWMRSGDYGLNNSSTSRDALLSWIETDDVPTSYKSAVSSSDSVSWRDAMDKEYQSLISNGTWTLVDLPEGCTAIKCGWVFKRKEDLSTMTPVFKARLPNTWT